MVFDLSASYRSARQRLSALYSNSVDDTIAARKVPATPEWTVHDLLSHLAGVTEDAATMNMDGVTTDPWTAAQVERGRSKSIADLIEMWGRHAPVIEGFLASAAGESAYRAVIDILTHEYDVRHALGLPADLPAGDLAWVGATARSEFVHSISGAHLPLVEVIASDFEWFRSRLGRRTVGEVCAYDWSSDPAPYLEHWFVFGHAEQSLGETDHAQ